MLGEWRKCSDLEKIVEVDEKLLRGSQYFTALMIFVEKISISQKSANRIQRISENFNIVIVIAIYFNIEEIHDITSMVQKSFIVFFFKLC